jgi:hypothetical protein
VSLLKEAGKKPELVIEMKLNGMNRELHLDGSSEILV